MFPPLAKSWIGRYPRVLAEARGMLEVGPGWLPILERLFADLEALENPPLVGSVKSKFARLRVSAAGADALAAQMIAHAEACAAVTCEECGAPGATVEVAGVWAVLCGDHHKLRKADAGPA